MIPTSKFLNSLATWLDIPDAMHEDAVERYTEIGEHLEGQDRKLGRNPPLIYPQGSFRLGTVIKPLSNADEYDIDLVYRREILKTSTTQEQLKAEAGEHLRAFLRDKEKASEDAPELDVGCRCWVLNYSGRFHMDVLPAIPNELSKPDSLWITDRNLRQWQQSNPVGYAQWFHAKMGPILPEQRQAYAASIQASVEEVEDWQVKTVLQRMVQLLKRHRDVYFRDHPDDRTASIIVTTLAAHAYRSETDLLTALRNAAASMWQYVRVVDGKYLIPNPVHPAENFADRWNQSPARAEWFKRWMAQLKHDVGRAELNVDGSSARHLFAAPFGSTAIDKALDSLDGGRLKTATALALVPALGDSRHALAPLWPEVKLYNARIQGEVRSKGGKMLWKMRKDWAVPKRVKLRFQVETNAPEPYEVKWQVTNTGAEAAAANMLRGDFYVGETAGGRVREEPTAFAGTHWVEAFVIKDGRTVARSGKYEVRIKP